MIPRARNWVLAGSAAMVVGVLALHILWPQPGQDDVYWPWPLGLMAFPVAAAFILVKRPGNGVGRLRTELDLGEINAEILGVVTTTMQPTTASVWIREDGR